MDIKIPHQLLANFLDTPAPASEIARALTLCGPSVDRLTPFKSSYVYETEVITNRVDSASAFGLAREATAILPQFGEKASLLIDPYRQKTFEHETADRLSLNIQILDQSLIGRFCLIILDNITVKPSPKHIIDALEAVGERSINNLVDITNYITLALGQPAHIFDYDKISGATMELRQSLKGEKVTTLDGREHTLKGGDIVIQDGSGQLIDLCGIMGGSNSQVDENTKRAVLFIQTYHPQKIRRTSLYTQERTLAAQIFEKSPDPEMVMPALNFGVSLLKELSGAKIASQLVDIYPTPLTAKPITLSLKWLNSFLGVTISPKQILDILSPLGFEPQINNQSLNCFVPTWRLHDISLPEDLAEEISRVYGYFRFPSLLPSGVTPLTPVAPALHWEYPVKNYLANIGYTEVYNFSLVSAQLFSKATLSIDHSIELKNPLSSDFQYMRRSLIPGILEVLENNRGKASPPIRVFELSNIYLHGHDPLPTERPILCLANQGDTFFQAKGYIESLLEHLHLHDIRFAPLSEASTLFIPEQSAEIYQADNYLGIIGTISPRVISNFHIDSDVIITNLDFELLSRLATPVFHLTSVPDYPAIIESITISSDLPVGEIISLIKSSSSYVSKVIYISSYHRNHTFEVHFNHPKRNLTQTEVNQLKQTLLELK